jgi:hypothetical protein
MLREEILKFLLGIIVIIREKVRKKYDLDQNVVKVPAIGKPEKVFWVAGELFDCNSSRLLMFLYTMLT